MSSAIRQLARKAANSDTRISDLLREAWLIADELDLKEFAAWLEGELKGYSLEACEDGRLPKYQCVKGVAVGSYPGSGLQPVRFHSSALEVKLTNTPIIMPIDELADMGSKTETY